MSLTSEQAAPITEPAFLSIVVQVLQQLEQHQRSLVDHQRIFAEQQVTLLEQQHLIATQQAVLVEQQRIIAVTAARAITLVADALVAVGDVYGINAPDETSLRAMLCVFIAGVRING
ncbi:hypothetical protein CERSUDRAFT_96143 [Gelatoporia subvermispora B]|uniref:Uncharacterized protein n=1 Tax=Ceriporiopsis subvermispora (strain B) TaxID=914234 RepID=M2RC23_CERS8|nr:hypothetical protein CERSUDRAFT_96143 [Gelatoporia subvermispora B]